MRVLLATTTLLACAAFAVNANPAPLSAKDVSLMLRSGFTPDAVEREVANRHFLGTLDAAAEKNLAAAGASPALITKLKSGAFAVPASEAVGIQADLKAKEQRRAAQQEEARKFDTLYQAQLAQKRNGPPASAAAPGSGIAALVKGNLVSSQNGTLRPYADAEFEKKKLIGLYFSAHWCGPCRQFTPSLVEYYRKNAPAHPEFEILFVSNDKTASAMEGYMREVQMPWPALSFDKIAGSAALTKYAGSGIPCLVVVDETGKVVFDTYSGKEFRGPAAVLADLDRHFATKGPGQVAQVR
jgi:thiol-disulfide isomerase/thioredoxin